MVTPVGFANVMGIGEENLLLMTSTFDVLSEAPLNTEDFGEGKLYLVA